MRQRNSDHLTNVHHTNVHQTNAQNKTVHHSIKLITTVLFSTVVISFGKYEILRLLPFFVFPMLLFAGSNLQVKVLMKRLLLIEPLILGIGILNPFFESETFMLGGLVLSMGWLSFASLFIRSLLILMTAIVLAESLALEEALIGLKVPPIFVTQVALTYRYIGLLTKEVKAVLLAYRLRSSRRKNVRMQHMGSILGHFFLRTLDKANTIHEAMMLRGFDGTHHGVRGRAFKGRDVAYLVIWTFVLIGLRIFDVGAWIGILMMGGAL